MQDEPTVLILAPLGRDARIAASILASKGIATRICGDLEETVAHLDSAHCLVVAEEALVHSDRNSFAAWLASQPPWSDFPIVLLTMRETELDARLGFIDRYLIVLERPFLASSLTNSVRAALRARARQLEVKSLLEQKEEVARRQQLLIRELHHRVKNTLANVRAMMGATARSADNVDEFIKDFSARLVSLAETHSMLTDDYWQTAQLHKLLETELRPYATRDASRVAMHGPEVSLVADLAIPIGMAIHELASNSSKYGALSKPDGSLDIRWSVNSSAAGASVLDFGWRESNGPKVTQPKRRGFGTTLLEKVVAVQCHADISLKYEAEGFEFAMKLPLRDTRLVPHY
jgi:two-component sensor histidine kinase